MRIKQLLTSVMVLAAFLSCEREPVGGKDEPDPAEEGFTIAGEAAASYRIVYDGDETEGIIRNAAILLRNAFKEYTQSEVQVFSESTREAEREILVGDCGRKEGGSGSYSDSFEWSISCINGKIYIEGGSSWAVLGGVKSLINKYISQDIDIPADIAASGSCRSTYIFDKPSGTNLRLLDYNIWAYDKTSIPSAFYSDGVLLYDPRNEKRSKDFASVVRCTEPDVFAFQEYSEKMSVYFEPLVISKFKKCTTADSQWSWTPLFYNSSTVTLKKVVYRLYDAPWSNSNSKSFTAALFTHKESGKGFIVIGTHLWWKSESAQAGSNNARLEQAGLIIEQARQMLETDDVPVFVMGDMNCNHASTAIQAFVVDGYKSASKEASEKRDGSRGYHSCSENGFSPETEDQLKDVNGDTAIDHILYKNCDNKADVRYYTIIHTSFTYPMSDHAPRYVDVTLK